MKEHQLDFFNRETIKLSNKMLPTIEAGYDDNKHVNLEMQKIFCSNR